MPECQRSPSPRVRLIPAGIAAVVLLLAGSGSPAEEPAPAARVPTLRIEYRTRSVPQGGAADEKVTRVHRITVDLTGSRLIFEEEGEPPSESRRFILDVKGSKPVLYEILEGGRKYREHPGDLNDLQKQRRISEENERQIANDLSRKDREAFYRQNPWLRPDGKRVVDVARKGGEKVLGRDCEHVVVTETGRTIVEGEVTRDVPGARSYFQLYRRLGAFSDEVLEKLAELEGVLLRGRILVVTALRPNELEVEATSLEELRLERSAFSVEGLERVEMTPKEVPCGFCKRSVNPARAGGKGVYEGKIVYFCSEACAAKFRDARLGILPAGAPPGSPK
ncbi:MAG TPA: hypothetical protein VMT52_19350 [Planctomycetota bacterium]|nr:hypothetical protein [Planctomycetota bacterium]